MKSNEDFNDSLEIFRRQVARFAKMKQEFFFGQASLLMACVWIHATMGSRWLYGIPIIIGYLHCCFLPGPLLRMMEVNLNHIRQLGPEIGLSDDEVDFMINQIGRREMRGGLLNPPLFGGMVCLGFIGLWIFLMISVILNWGEGVVIFLIAASVFGLTMFGADKLLGKDLKVSQGE